MDLSPKLRCTTCLAVPFFRGVGPWPVRGMSISLGRPVLGLGPALWTLVLRKGLGGVSWPNELLFVIGFWGCSASAVGNGPLSVRFRVCLFSEFEWPGSGGAAGQVGAATTDVLGALNGEIGGCREGPVWTDVQGIRVMILVIMCPISSLPRPDLQVEVAFAQAVSQSGH